MRLSLSQFLSVCLSFWLDLLHDMSLGFLLSVNFIRYGSDLFMCLHLLACLEFEIFFLENMVRCHENCANGYLLFPVGTSQDMWCGFALLLYSQWMVAFFGEIFIDIELYVWGLIVNQKHFFVLVPATVQYVAVPITQTPSKASPYKTEQPQLLPKTVASQHVSWVYSSKWSVLC